DLALPCGDGVMAKRKILQGTPVYLAPEQLDQTEFDQRADIFSFGLIAYEILSGGKRPTDKMLSNAPNFDLDMPPLSECNPTVPRGIQNVIGKCLASTPSQRYPSASALVRALQKEFELLSPAAS
ncbi:MAG: protein kinase, partial [Verrucomicrobiae bacterium]|nr:protein kinase [Verrucomicrobiae bacterium]